MRALWLSLLLMFPAWARPNVTARVDQDYRLHLVVQNPDGARPIGFPPYRQSIPQGWRIQVKDNQGQLFEQKKEYVSVQAFHPSHLVLVDKGKKAAQTVDLGVFENWQGKTVSRNPGKYTVTWSYEPTPVPFYPKRLDLAWKSFAKGHSLLPAIAGGTLSFQVRK